MNKAGQKKSFAQTYPEYVKLWHPSKNGLVALSDLAPGSERVSWWVCDNGHEYQRKPVHQARASGKCPSCKGFAFKYPHLALLWHPTKNHQKVLSDIFRGSQRKAWWICVNNHEYERTPYDQVKFSGHCPVCVGRKIGEDNHLGVEFPDVAKQWNFSRNGALLPDHVRPQWNKTVWWSCDFGHEYQMIIYQKTAGAGCPFCLGKRASPEDNLSVRFRELPRSGTMTGTETFCRQMFGMGQRGEFGGNVPWGIHGRCRLIIERPDVIVRIASHKPLGWRYSSIAS